MEKFFSDVCDSINVPLGLIIKFFSIRAMPIFFWGLTPRKPYEMYVVNKSTQVMGDKLKENKPLQSGLLTLLPI